MKKYPPTAFIAPVSSILIITKKDKEVVQDLVEHYVSQTRDEGGKKVAN